MRAPRLIDMMGAWNGGAGDGAKPREFCVDSAGDGEEK